MSDNQIKIVLDAPAQAVVARMQSLPMRVLQDIASAMKKENQFTVSHIQAEHLTGQGPFPVEEHKLGVRTNRLRSSARATDPVISGQHIDSAIGSNVIYAAIHEFGGRINKPARQAKIRLRTDARGNLVRQMANTNLARFARSDHKRARETTVAVAAHSIDMPERAPFRTGIQECRLNYTKSISAAMIKSWGGKK